MRTAGVLLLLPLLSLSGLVVPGSAAAAPGPVAPVAPDRAACEPAAGSTCNTARTADLTDPTDVPAPVVDVVRATGSSRTADFVLAFPEGLTASCTLVLRDVVVSPAAPCGPQASYDLGTLPDGPYTLQAGLTDPDGRRGPVGQATYVLDTLAPDVPAAAAGDSGGGQVTWSWPDEPGVTWSCTLTSAADVVLAGTACQSPLVTDLSTGPGTAWSFALTGTDAAGNSATTVTAWTSAPGTPVVTTPEPTSGAHPVWSLQGATGLSCALLHGDTVVLGPQPCTGRFSADLTGADEGDYVLRLTDEAASDGVVATSRYRYDATAPVLSVVAVAPVTSSRTPLVLLVSDDPTALLTCRLPGAAEPETCSGSATGTPLPVDLAGLPDGSWTVQVDGADPAGNPVHAEAALVLDTVAPAPPQVRTPASPGATPYPVWTVTGPDEDVTLACTLTEPDGSTGPAACTSGRFTTGPLGDEGDWVLSAVATDRAGNDSAAVHGSYAYDRTAPATAVLAAQQGPVGSAPTATWTWSAQEGVRTVCTLLRGEEPAGTALPSCTSPFTLELGSGAPDGAYRLLVQAVDPAGNLGVAREGGYVLDRTPPAAPGFTASPGSPSSSPQVVWGVETPLDGALRCVLRRDGRDLGEPHDCGTAPGEVAEDLSTSGRGAGTYVLRTWSHDLAGNVSAAVDSPAYVLRASALPQVRWTGGPSGFVSSVTTDWTFTGAEGATFTCRLLRDSRVLRALSACDGTSRARDLTRAGVDRKSTRLNSSH